MTGTEEVAFWIRSDVIIRSLLPYPPPPNLNFINLRRIVGYQVVKYGKSMSFSQWRHIAVDKLQLSDNLAWIYYSTFLLLLPKIDNSSYNVTDIRDAVFEGPKSDWLTKERISVPIGEFVIFLVIQLANKTSELTSSYRFNESYPNIDVDRPMSPSSSFSSESPRFRYNINGEQRIMEFIHSNIKQIIELSSLVQSKIIDYHILPTQTFVTSNCMKSMDLLLEGHDIKSEISQITPKTFTHLIEKRNKIMSSNSKIPLEEIVLLVRSRLVADPFNLLDPLDSFSSKSVPYLKTSKTDNSDRRLIVLGNIVARTYIRSSNAMQNTYVRISNCKMTNLYLVTTFQCVTIELCRKCTIVLGPVNDVVRIRRCFNCIIIVPCGSIVISDSQNCQIHVKTSANPLLLGNNIAITLAPYHTNYQNLSLQMECAGLSFHKDLWNKPLILTSEGMLKMPNETIWSEMSPERFFPFVMPFKSHKINEPPILGLPKLYEDAIENRLKDYNEYKEITNVLNEYEMEILAQFTSSHFKQWINNNSYVKLLKQIDELDKYKKY